MTEPKPPVKGELLPCPFCRCHAKIEETVCDNTIWCQSCCARIVYPKNNYTLEEVVAAWNTRSGTYIPADDFGRILEALVAIAGDNDTDGNSMECDNHEACQDKAFKALALARKYGSAE